MADNQNPGNFANRPHEEVENIARKGGQSSHSGGFASMDSEKQVRSQRLPTLLCMFESLREQC
jgi:general stress protein YciG